MKAVAVVGYKNSGKTSLVLQLIEQLAAQGLRVAAAKFTHHALDRRDSDTDRLSERAHCVLGLGREQTSLFWNKPSFLSDLLPLLDSDVLIIEGGRQLKNLPRIILPREADEAQALADDRALAVWSGSSPLPAVPAYQDVAGLAERILLQGFLLPGLDCQACGYESCARLAEDIVAGLASPEACQAVSQAFSVTVNGAEIPLNPFVRSIISGSILGMLSQLKGFSPGNIDIRLEM